MGRSNTNCTCESKGFILTSVQNKDAKYTLILSHLTIPYIQFLRNAISYCQLRFSVFLLVQ